MGFKSVSKEDMGIYFSTIFDSPLMGIVVTDSKGGVYEANAAFLEMIGYSREELESGKMSWIEFTAPEYREFSAEIVEDLLKYGTTKPLEKEYLHKNGDRVVAMTVVHKIKEIEGRFISCILNISEVKKMKSSIDQAMKAATLGQFTSEIIHDFNNIVCAVQLATDVMETKLESNNIVNKEINLIRKTTDRAANLTKHLLAFCRSDKNENSDWNPGQAAKEMSEILQRLLGKKCQLEMKSESDVSDIIGCKTQFEQILMNLTINARDAMPGGGVILVEVQNQHLTSGFQDVYGEALPVGDYVKIRVKDSGTGIEESNKKRIFDPYFTTKPKGVGTGLGLSTVISAVKTMGGGLTMTSEVGVGTDFNIFIPVKKRNTELLNIA